MGELLYVFYFSAIVFAIFPILVIAVLRKSYPYPFLSRYQLFLIIHNILFFFDLILRYLGRHLGIIRIDQFQKLDNLYAFILVPAMVALGYLFWLFVSSLSEKRLARIYTGVYFGYWIVFLIAFVIVEGVYFKTANFRPAGFLMFFFNGGLILFFGGAVFWLYVQMKHMADPQRRKLTSILVWYYILAFVIIFLSWTTLLPFITDRIFKHLFALFYNVPAVLMTVYYVPKFIGIPDSDKKDAGMEKLFLQNNISRREQDIVRGILRGQCNAEIGRELHISQKTVETHIYNIYQKLSIKNRIQLLNIFKGSP